MITAKEALKRLREGNERFYNETGKPPDLTKALRETLETGQAPFATILTCSDSRVAPEHIFNVGLGEIFVVRTAGNIIDAIALGSIEYAIIHLKTPLLLVLGHESCGAIKASLGPCKDEPKYIQSIISKIKNSWDEKSPPVINEAIHLNIERTIKEILEQSEAIADKAKNGGLTIVPAFYNLNGSVEFI